MERFDEFFKFFNYLKKPRQIDVVLNYSPYERSDSTNFFNFGENLIKFWNTL